MARLIIPLNGNPNQSFKSKVSVNGENIELTFLISFNEVCTYWLMDISRRDNTLVSAIPLIPGDYPSGNLLGQYSYLGIGSAFIVPVTEVGTDEWPYSNTLGSKWLLLWSDED